LKSALAGASADLRGLKLLSHPARVKHQMSVRVGGFHPGLLSGLVLAGANRPRRADPESDSASHDGILTAEEVAAMDLASADLATLSACETGLGEVAGGEGVFGLQRAFQVAGARTVVASMWKVEDNATQTLMIEFYKNLWEKRLGRLESLRQAQLTMIRNYDTQTGRLRQAGGTGPEAPASDAENVPKEGKPVRPFYWAGFVLSGDWR
jgi:CHAT domain-containing protein